MNKCLTTVLFFVLCALALASAASSSIPVHDNAISSSSSVILADGMPSISPVYVASGSFSKGARDAPIIIETFIDMTCPFSARAFPKLLALVEESKGAIQARYNILPQPWHPHTCHAARAVIAFSQLKPENTLDYIGAVFAGRDSFTPDDKVKDMSAVDFGNLFYSFAKDLGVDETAFKSQLLSEEIDVDLKFFLKYSRQNGVHVTPTYMINGIIYSECSSGWDVATWMEYLKPVLPTSSANVTVTL